MHKGMIGLDKKNVFRCRSMEFQYLLKLLERLSAKNLVAKAKSLLSPYFGAHDLAFAYALS